jgi:hypothetical protein
MAKMTTILEWKSISEVVSEASFFRPELNEVVSEESPTFSHKRK